MSFVPAGKAWKALICPTGSRKSGITSVNCLIFALNSFIVLSALEKYWMTVSFSSCLISGIFCTTEVTDGAALKSVSNAVLTLSHTLVSIPRAIRQSN